MPISDALIDRTWDDDIVPQITEYIRVPAKSPALRPRLGAQRPHRRGGAPGRGLGPAATGQGARGRDGPPRRPHAGAVLRSARESRCRRRRDGAALRPPRQAARDARLARRPRSVDAGDARTASLYGRGGADDGYAVFASLTAIAALQAQGVPHARCVVLIETCEESGSYDLPAYIDAPGAAASARVDLVVCLDSGCGNYEQLWITTSLRGIAAGTLTRRGADRGRALGRRQRRRAVDLPHRAPAARPASRTPRPAASCRRSSTRRSPPSASRRHGPRRTSSATSSSASSRSPGARSRWSTDRPSAMLNRTWRPALSVTGADGLPPIANAGNVLRPKTALKLSLRLPPTLDASAATRELKRLLEADPPYGAHGHLRARPGRRPAGTRRRRRPGSRRRSQRARRPASASRPRAWARAARSRSWGCSASVSRTRSS